jgi:hypothetical protein
MSKVAAIPTVTWNKDNRKSRDNGKSSDTTSANGSNLGLTAFQVVLFTQNGNFIF